MIFQALNFLCKIPLRGLLILSFLLLVSCLFLSLYTFASEDEQLQDIQDVIGQTFGLDEEQEHVQNDEQIIIDFEPYENYNEYPEYIPYNDTDSEILLTLKSIEYQLKIVSGGMVLALISLFIWFTILKPIKGFTRF